MVTWSHVLCYIVCVQNNLAGPVVGGVTVVPSVICDSLPTFPEDALLASPSPCSVGHMSLPSVSCALLPQNTETATQNCWEE